MTTRVDFHSKVADKLNYACRLVRKARAADCHIVIYSDNDAQLRTLDEALWTFSELDFLPHAMAADAIAAQTPVILANNLDSTLPHHQILINLSSETPTNFTLFERMLEIVSAESADAAAGRERYRYYQQQGHPLTHFVADKI